MAEPTTTPTNAVAPTTTDSGGGDAGTNAETRTLEQTQAINGVDANGYGIGFGIRDETGALSTLRRNPETGDLYDPGGISSASANIDPGIGAYDDSGVGTPQDTSALPGTISATFDPDDLFSKNVTPQGNVLDRFSSYTYRASWYLMKPEQVSQLMASHKKNINGYQLLIQSGGAPSNTSGFQGALGQSATFYENDGSASTSQAIPGANAPSSGRSPAFPNDFYFDSITIENLVTTGGRFAHASSDIKFTIIEPNNITLIDRLYEAVQDYLGGDARNPVNYNAATYMMVIRFYGYDENGNLIVNAGAADPKTGLTDPNAVIEKFIPFRISKLDWSIQNKLVEYRVEGKPLGQIIASGTRRGTVPADVQLNSTTVGQLLSSSTYSSPSNNASNATASTEQRTGVNLTNTSAGGGRGSGGNAGGVPYVAPAKADGAPTPKTTGGTKGLMAALNDYQQQLVQQGIYDVADEYEIVFAKGAESIANAKIVPPGTKVEAKQTAMAAPTTENADSLDPRKIAKDNSSKNWSITAGMQVVQAIELAIRNSTYILDQQLVQDDPTTDATINNPKAEGKPVTWFQISFTAVPKTYDKLRNDYAYKITFTISPYFITNYNSKYFPVTKFNGVHKSYQYWFTGHNTAVLDYQETMNNLYNITVSGSAPQNNIAEQNRRKLTSSMREIPFYSYQAASTETRQGTEGKAFEGAANLTEVLYDPVGLANTKLKIVGDPAWIQQGSIAGGVSAREFNYNAFLPDGTINFDASQILFEVAWQRPQDYDLQTGLADPYSNNPNAPRQPLQSRVYTAQKCISEFNKGKFEQTIEGKLYMFIKPDASNKAGGASVPVAQNGIPTQADVRRIDNAISKSSQDAASAGSRGSNGATPAPEVTPGTGQSGGSAEWYDYNIPGPNDTVQPSLPPTGATSGTGESVAWYDYEPPTDSGRINISTLNTGPDVPQDITREA